MRDEEFDLRAAINAVSDVVQNRPRPLRDFDQIYMKTGDMVLQSQFVADWADGKRLAFMGDGDSIAVAVAYLRARGIIDYGPEVIKVFDFDERIVGSIKRFADSERLTNLDAELYNCFDPIPQQDEFDCFYSNPPWGASNGGESVNVFLQRGLELVHFSGEGMIVIADDDNLPWPGEVLANVQAFASRQGFYVCRMMRQLHSYHLDDNPDLRSCNVIFKSRLGNENRPSEQIRDAARLANFYGEASTPTVRYIKEQKRLDYGKAHDDEYSLEFLEDV